MSSPKPITLPTREDVEAYISLTPKERRTVNSDPRCLLLFFTYYFAEAVTYPFAAFHADFANDLVDLYEGTVTELAWCTARETAKSAFASAFVLWHLLNNRNDYTCWDSYDKGNADGALFDLFNILQTNPRVIDDYGRVCSRNMTDGEKTKRQTGDFIVDDHRITSHSTSESFRGRRHNVYIRPGLVVFDDFEVNKTVRSETETRNIAEHISEGTSGLDQKRGRRLYLCNWLSDYGNVASIKARSEQDSKCRFREVWRVDKETGLPSWPERDVLTDAELLLPGNDGKISIETKRKEKWKPDVGYAEWELEMQGNCIDPLGDGPDKQGFMALFPKGTIRVTNDTFTETPPYSIGVDPSGEGKDETVIVVRSAFQARIYATEQKSTGKSIALMVVKAMKEHSVPAESVVVDAFGVGFKCVQELALMGHHVRAVNVGETAVMDSKWQTAYRNDRAYAAFMLKEWMTAGGTLCYDRRWEDELRLIRFRNDDKGRRQIIPKREIIRRGYKSPNGFDALSLSFLCDMASERTRVTPADPNPISDFLG